MTRRRALAAAAVAGAIAIVLAGVLLLRSATADRPARVGADGIAARAVLSPRVQLFGDIAVARLELLVDRAALDPDWIRVDAAFEPYEPLGALVAERDDGERVTRLRYEVRLRCLTGGCVPELSKQAYRLRPARVLYVDPARTSSARVLRRVPWPPVEIASRLEESEISPADGALEIDWRADVLPLPGVTYRVSPSAASALLLALALALVAAAALLVRRALRPVLRREQLDYLRMTPLERALFLVERAHERGAAEERRLALDRLAAELRTTGETGLASSARELAWAPPAPASDATAQLATSVREMIDGRTNGRPA